MRDVNKVKVWPKNRAGFTQAPSDGAYGFTIIELMVAISMMVIIAGLFVVNLAGQRSTRSLNIAQNELVSNLRKIQSYTLAGRMINNNQPVQYYVAKFNRTGTDASGYTLQAIYQDAVGNWKLAEIEKINFPVGVTLDSSSGIKIDNNNTTACALLTFRAPFAKIVMNDGCSISSPPAIGGSDDYQKILDFVYNVSGSPTATDKKMTLTFQFQNGASKKVLVNGVTGMICPSTDGLVCN